MKKFYEAPVVELTGFSAEDVITTSTNVYTIDTNNIGDFNNAAAAAYGSRESYGGTVDYGSYTW